MECRICKSPVVLADDLSSIPIVVQMQFYECVCREHAEKILDECAPKGRNPCLSNRGTAMLNQLDKQET